MPCWCWDVMEILFPCILLFLLKVLRRISPSGSHYRRPIEIGIFLPQRSNALLCEDWWISSRLLLRYRKHGNKCIIDQQLEILLSWLYTPCVCVCVCLYVVCVCLCVCIYIQCSSTKDKLTASNCLCGWHLTIRTLNSCLFGVHTKACTFCFICK